ncbi:MAG: hypothetical protein M4579_004428 [Chaenotheca gracillima]|nr:MAG: hypothetical protein M4579_004428 [Chaenotheca gracillima]
MPESNDIQDSNVRRRHSSHYDDVELADPLNGGGPSQGGVRERRASEDGRAGNVASISSAVDNPTSPSSDLSPIAHTPHVRFSEDIERVPVSSVAASSAGGPARSGSLPAILHAATLDRPGTPNLSIDTGGATTLGPSGAGGRSLGSPSSPTSPQSARQTSKPPQLSPSSPSSPTSAKSRNRGYSLRRTLFARNIHDHSDGDGSGIELASAGPSSTPGLHQAIPESQTPRKKSGDTTITISPAIAEEEARPGEKKARKTYAIDSLPNYESWARRRASQSGLVRKVRHVYHSTRKRILKINEIPPSKDGRHLDVLPFRSKALTDERTGRGYVGNTIRSSRYSAWNFLPRQLFAQFSKLANFYFLCVSILQMIPGLSTTGTYTTIVPLLFFVTISIAKEGYDDLRRYRLDKAENNRTAKTFKSDLSPDSFNSEEGAGSSGSSDPSYWKTTTWKDIQVGDIVRLKRDEATPADIVLLHATGPNHIAYVETMALDGETNLKSKQACPPLASHCSTIERMGQCNAHLVVEDPNLDLYNFEGRVTVDHETIPLTNNEIMYRGSVLRNTPEAIGLVIYTGEECKIRMNATKNPRIKAPSLQARVNRIVIIIVIFVIALSIFNTVAYQIWSGETEDESWYLANAGVSFFPIFASFIIMFNTMIPLSLYVSLEIVKLAQMYFLNDVDMYDEASNTPMEARTSTINEELGQVSHIFSDKTGTLTDNSMRFRRLSVAGTSWLHDIDLQREAAMRGDRPMLRHKKRKGKKALSRKSMASESGGASRRSEASPSRDPRASEIGDKARSERTTSRHRSPSRTRKTRVQLRTEDLLHYIALRPHSVFAKKARFFLLSIALCHTCIPEPTKNGEMEYQAASPDELALVRAAQEMDFMVIDRQTASITLKTFPAGPEGEPSFDVYEVLDVIEFSSKRKRMSIVVRMPDQRICIFCKGADSTIMQLLRQSNLAKEKATEVERRASLRKSMEAQMAMRRNSEAVSRKSTANRPSMALSRPSIGGISRSSMTGNRIQPIRDEVDSWLTHQERDVDATSIDESSLYLTPRTSENFGNRLSVGGPESIRGSVNEPIEKMVDESVAINEALVFERCFQHINEFATEGLRTLMYSYRFMDEAEYTSWKKVYQDATTSLVDRQMMVEQAGEQIEKDLELAGATAIEDRLQKGVPEAIDKLRRASIKMWMLTGDKRETAINIGHSCRLIKDYSNVTILDHETGHVEHDIAQTIVALNSGSVAHSVVVIDGQTLGIIESDKTLASLFFDLAILVDSVICCRASPSQKASLVRSIRKKVKNSVTLAIGDGANDIAMIQEAHVGIGITGKEGLQAARISDYSIAQFRFLLKLLLVHGRWNYIRTCKYTLGTFWKEMLFYLTQALYQRWAGYTGTSLYESWSLSMFNTLFTSLPVIFLGIFEKDLAASTLLAVPELYTKGQRSEGFNIKVYLGWMFLAASEAMVVFFVMLGLYGQAIITLDDSLYAMGVLTFTACVVIIAAKIQFFEMHNKSVVVLISVFLCVGGWFLWNLILSAIYSNNTVYDVKGGFIHRFGDSVLWWLVLILIVASCFVFEIGVAALRSAWFPTDVDLFQEYERDLPIRKRFEEAASSELQMGWDRGKKRPSFEIEREKEIQALLDRPRIMEEGNLSSEESGNGIGGHLHHRRRSLADKSRRDASPLSRVSVDKERQNSSTTSAPPSPDIANNRRSADIQEMFKRGFGSIQKG